MSLTKPSFNILTQLKQFVCTAFKKPNAIATRSDFMSFFRDSEKLNELSPDDRVEVFLGVLLGASDITVETINGLFSDYGVDDLFVFSSSDIERRAWSFAVDQVFCSYFSKSFLIDAIKNGDSQQPFDSLACEQYENESWDNLIEIVEELRCGFMSELKNIHVVEEGFRSIMSSGLARE
jgi:hypothetical protein